MWFMIWLIQKLLKLNLNLIIRLMQPDSGEIRIDINTPQITDSRADATAKTYKLI